MTAMSGCAGVVHFYLRDVVSAVLSVRQRGWVAGCHSRYCIKKAKPILKLFRPSGGRPIIPVSSDFYADTQF